VYRYQWSLEIHYGRRQELLEIVKQIKQIEISRGWSPVTVWTPVFGQMHTLTLEADYPDLESFEREEERRSADAKFTELMSRTVSLLVQGTSHVRLFVSHD